MTQSDYPLIEVPKSRDAEVYYNGVILLGFPSLTATIVGWRNIRHSFFFFSNCSLFIFGSVKTLLARTYCFCLAFYRYEKWSKQR